MKAVLFYLFTVLFPLGMFCSSVLASECDDAFDNHKFDFPITPGQRVSLDSVLAAVEEILPDGQARVVLLDGSWAERTVSIDRLLKPSAATTPKDDLVNPGRSTDPPGRFQFDHHKFGFSNTPGQKVFIITPGQRVSLDSVLAAVEEILPDGQARVVLLDGSWAERTVSIDRLLKPSAATTPKDDRVHDPPGFFEWDNTNEGSRQQEVGAATTGEGHTNPSFSMFLRERQRPATIESIIARQRRQNNEGSRQQEAGAATTGEGHTNPSFHKPFVEKVGQLTRQQRKNVEDIYFILTHEFHINIAKTSPESIKKISDLAPVYVQHFRRASSNYEQDILRAELAINDFIEFLSQTRKETAD